MEMYKNDVALIIKNEENNRPVKNSLKSNNTEQIHICKLNDFFSNNSDVELSRISILQLSNCNINEIPPNIQKLNLKQLILTHNNLKEVPSCLYSGLKTLELLDLSHNFIKSFDIEPGCSCTIVTLRLNNNKIRNLPHWILTLPCPRLIEVSYSNNKVTSLKASRALNIKKLEMCNCQLIDVDFKFFRAIKTLEYLDISNNNPPITDENRFKDIDQLFWRAKWIKLKVLKLNNLTMSIIPQGIFWIESLSELYLISCDLSWIPETVQYLNNLTILDISHNTLCSLPVQLSFLNNLKVIKAPFNSITSVADFGNNLEILDLYSNYLEAPPDCTDKVKLIDLELNYFETNDLEMCSVYLEKREQLRQKFNYTRTNGPRELLNEYIPSQDDYTDHSESDDVEICQNQIDDEEFENWDEEKSKVDFQKNPEVTPSDDEWEGKEDCKKRINKSELSKKFFDENEEWIFCDVEE